METSAFTKNLEGAFSREDECCQCYSVGIVV